MPQAWAKYIATLCAGVIPAYVTSLRHVSLRMVFLAAVIANMDKLRFRNHTLEIRMCAPVFPLGNLMANKAQSNKVLEIVSLNVGSEGHVWLNVVDLQAIDCAAMLAGVAISFLGNLALPTPVRAAIVKMTTFPRRAIWAGHVSRRTLPFETTCRIAEIVRPHFARSSAQRDSASVTRDDHGANVLYMCFSAWAMLLAPFTFTRLRAIDMRLGCALTTTYDRLAT